MVSEVDEKRKIDKCAAQFLKQTVSVLGHQKRLWGSPLVLLGSGMIKLIKRQKNENLPICDLNRKAPYNLHKKTTDQRSLSVGKDFFWVQKYIFSVKFPNILPEMMFIRK